MFTGKTLIDQLYSELLHVEEEWSVKTENGFRWWPFDHAQTIDVIGEANGPDGKKGYFISVRTELVKVPRLDERILNLINRTLMPHASLAGPVYDSKRGILELCSHVLVHEGNSKWIGSLLCLAAELQIYETQTLANTLEVFNMEKAVSGHPLKGVRKETHKASALVPSIITQIGKEPSKWIGHEFQEVVQDLENWSLSLLATASKDSMTAEFPYGDFSSLCRIFANQPHPFYGNGLLVTHFFPVSRKNEENMWIQKALLLNEPIVSNKATAYGFGSYLFRDEMLTHVAFFPNVVYRRGLLKNIYMSAGIRSMAMHEELEVKLGGKTTFSAPNSAFARFMTWMQKD